MPATAWAGLSAGDGTKGPRLYDWAYLELADLDAEEVGCPVLGTWTRGLLIRRSLNPPGQAERAPTRLRSDVVEGLRYVWGHPVLRAISIMMALINFVGATISSRSVA